MKILFICEGNVGRSQMAEELFNKKTKINKGISAGTNALKYGGRKLKDFAFLVVNVLKEKDIDVSNKIPIQLTPEMVKSADKIIVMTEKEKWPAYLLDSKKVEIWDMADGIGKDYNFHVSMRNQIETLVQNLIKEIG